MIEVLKSSHLVTASGDTLLADLKSRLIEDGLYFGFYPLDDASFSLNYYLSKRTANLYHFCYGSIADLVTSLTVELKNGKSFKMKDAPRSAIGPDFNRMIIGSRENFGQIKSATLKLIASPEVVSHLVLAVDDREHARRWIRDLIGHFITPLYFRFLDANNAPELLNAIKFKTDQTECLLICFGGLSEVVDTIHRIIGKWAQDSETPFKWLERHSALETIHPFVFSIENLKDIREQYKQFLWTTSDLSTQSEFDKDFVKFSLNE